MSEYDDMAAEEATAPTTAETPEPTAQDEAPNANPYEAMADDEVKQKASALKLSLYKAPEVKPDDAAKTYSLSKQTGYPSDVVARNQEQVSQQVNATDPQALQGRSPATAAWVTPPLHAQLAQGALSDMQAIEDTKRSHDNQSVVNQTFNWIMGEMLRETTGITKPEDVVEAVNAGASVAKSAVGIAGLAGEIPGGVVTAGNAIFADPFASKAQKQEQDAFAAGLRKNLITEHAKQFQDLLDNPSLAKEQGTDYATLWKTDKAAATRKFEDPLDSRFNGGSGLGVCCCWRSWRRRNKQGVGAWGLAWSCDCGRCRQGGCVLGRWQGWRDFWKSNRRYVRTARAEGWD